MHNPTNYAIASLAASQRAERAQPVRPFKANIGGPFRNRVLFDPGTPSTRAAQAAADAVARAERDAAALRDGYVRFALRSTYRGA